MREFSKERASDAPAQMSPEANAHVHAHARLNSPQDKLSRDAGQSLNSTPLTFLQRHFTRPVPADLDTTTATGSGQHLGSRHLSLTSQGFVIVVATAMILALIAAIAVAATLGAHADRPPNANGPGLILPHRASPIRSAIAANFPDPALYHRNGTWYAYATNNAAGIKHVENANASRNTPAFGQANVQIATSTDFINWTIASLAHQPLPVVGAWSLGIRSKIGKAPLSRTWAPGVGRRADGKYVMYYSSTWAGGNPRPNHPHPHCVGAAVSVGESPAGPYDAEKEVLTCPTNLGGAIDPEAYSENNTLWVVYKIDGNNVGNGGKCGNTVEPIQPTPILLQKMKPDGTTRDGEPVQILDRIASDGPLVEAPTIVRSAEGVYFLFFSSGCTRDPSYAVKYATSKNLAGPYKRAENALLKTGDWGLQSPGSAAIHNDGDGGWNMAFHARVYKADLGGIRAMFTTKLELKGDTAAMVRANAIEV